MIDRACISLGEKCNLKCKYCHFGDRLTGTPQEFELTDLISIINNINNYCIKKDIGVFKIGIVGSGEPLFEFHKIKSIIEYVKKEKLDQLSFYTITNGTLVSDDMLQFFLYNRERIALCFSLDGFEQIHNKGREKYDRVMKGIKKYETAFGHKPPVNCTVHKATIKNARLVREFFANEHFENVTFSRLVDTDDPEFRITNSEYDQFVQGSTDYNFSVRQLKKENLKKYDCTMYGKLCGVGRTNIFITKNGVYPCGRFYNNERYSYGSFLTDLSEFENKMKKMKSLSDGECYYDKYIGNTK